VEISFFASTFDLSVELSDFAVPVAILVDGCASSFFGLDSRAISIRIKGRMTPLLL
jgi:hypothetical protein